MKFRNIILLAIWSVVFGLLIVGYFLVNFWMRANVEARTGEDLRSNYATLREFNRLRLEEIAKSCQIIAETPRLKAVAEIGDRNTVKQLAEEFYQSALSDLFVLTGAHGEPLVQLVRGKPQAFSLSSLTSIQYATQNDRYTDVWPLDSMVFRIASAPIKVGTDIIGTVTIGFIITEADLQSSRSMTNSESILLASTTPIASTLREPLVAELTQWFATQKESTSQSESQSERGIPRIYTISTSDDFYEATFLRLSSSHVSASQGAGVTLIILKSVNQELQQALQPVQKTFFILSLVVLIVTIGIGYLISQTITRPIAALVRGTTEISKGNYDFQIKVPSGEELKFLALKFQEMSRSLKEKIQQLAVRNNDLEDALQKLSAMQEELVKSERLAATGRLTAQLSHEINNPVHNVLSCLHTALKRTATSAPERELIEVAYEEVERLARLTQQLLSVYRTSMTPQEPFSPVLLNDVIREVIASSAETLRQRSVDVELRLADALPTILGSFDKLKQVFINLILNARDAMPTGGTLTVVSSPINSRVQIAVSDTGIGIPPENIHRIFDAFFTTKSEVSGVGLGLSVTYGIVKQHNGTITVKSTVGQGTIFTLDFAAFTSSQDDRNS